MARSQSLLPLPRAESFKAGYNFRFGKVRLGNCRNHYEVAIVGVASCQRQFSFHTSILCSASGGELRIRKKGLSCRRLRCREAR